MATTSEERTEETTMELSHKTKTIQFLGRTTPIILQNDNGPCPLLAICNVLLLKNNLNFGPDVAEVSQEKLLSLVAERLIDSNSNLFDDKDAGYVENQQQNIADAIDLLPRLATGIDVNIKFTRIDDFEFTRECAIFDLLDIPLYHGWIVDPQDLDTANAIGKKSYNTLMGELVALETINMESEQKKNTEEDSVDFVAATTAVLGVPSPSLSRARSFDESPKAPSDHDIARKGDVEEEAELLRALRLSENIATILVDANDLSTVASNEHTDPELVIKEKVEICNKVENQASANEVITFEVNPKEAVILKANQSTDHSNSTSQEGAENVNLDGALETNVDVRVLNENAPSKFSEQNSASSCESHTLESNAGIESVEKPPTVVLVKPEPAEQDCEATAFSSLPKIDAESDSSTGKKPPTFVPDILKPETTEHDSKVAAFSRLTKADAESDSSGERRQDGDVPKVVADDSEPIYEGEECIMESETYVYENREPIYEGEVVLAKQGDTNTEASIETSLNDQISSKQGELIKNFLKNSASQLTIYGLFCLQDGLKERELCVFFRNNHFNTMFKFEGELYILATDQGYLNQPDLVWENLNEVNGNTVFMTSNFKEFKAETHDNSSWNERNAVVNTNEYISSIDNSANSSSSINSDLQLAIALQQQEFEHQQPQRNVQQQPVPTSSRLITGPQVPRQSRRNAEVLPRQESKSSKDKCDIM